MPAPIKRPRTLYDKVFDDHIVYSGHGDTILYCDRHLVHEVTSPQAFEGLRKAGRKVRRPDCTLATMDHNVPYVPALTFSESDDGMLLKRARIGHIQESRSKISRDM